jgi:spore coat polysaccharide biosynthesis protein SpsF
MIYWQIMRILQSTAVSGLVVATSTDHSDNDLVDFLKSIDVEVYRGSLENVLLRFEEIAKSYKPENIVRLTADCPLVMPEVLDIVVNKYLEARVDYVSNTLHRTFADGLDVEVFSSDALFRLSEYPLSQEEKEHVTLGIYSRPKEFSLLNVESNLDESTHRWTVDYQSDFDFVQKVYEHFRSKELEFGLTDLRLFISGT